MKRKISKKIGQKYFWDVDFENLDYKKSAPFIIERILEYGDQEAANWMLKNYNRDDIFNTLNSSRRISSRSRTYWNLTI